MNPSPSEASPYAVPKSQVSDVANSGSLVTGIWNPNAAANWSLIFSPAFGSYIHMLNWRALDQPLQAASARQWFFVSLVMLLVYVLMGVFISDEKAADGATRGLGFMYLLLWYFSAGRVQARYVKERWGKEYPRNSWGKPLLIGVAAMVGYFVLAVLIGVAIGVART